MRTISSGDSTWRRRDHLTRRFGVALRALAVAALLVVAPAAGPAHAALAASAAEPVERARLLMGTMCRIAASHTRDGAAERAVERAFEEIARWESILSDWDRGTELSRLAAARPGAPVPCSPDLFRFLSTALLWAGRTGGAFDPTVGPLVDLYDLHGSGRIPSRVEVERAMESVGFTRLALDSERRSATLRAPGMRLDPGAIGKGFALDEAARGLRESGVSWALLDFGGQILALGAGPDGRGFPVDVAYEGRRSPERLPILLSDASASTSASDERGLVVDGRELGHILDPRTGLPARGAISVTVIAPDATQADALSTALFVLGPERGLAAAEALGVEAIFTIDQHGTRVLRATPGFDRLRRAADRATDSPAATRP